MLETRHKNIHMAQSILGNFDSCNHDRSYMAIVITILPLWAILTTLIVFVLLAFHKNLRSTKVYDNCTKNNAHHTYLLEIRTGDTSATYNRRRTTLVIDMFDENQVTLARVAIPGTVIFGRKDAPIRAYDDDKYFELRVTRFWLYRSTRLKKVATIRLTHTCLETDAKIMVYGVELRSSERERPKLFFPVMNYISAYGAVGKPNACFDYEITGAISNMGGHQSDTSTVSEQLTWVDYTILTFLYSSLVFYSSTYDIIADSFTESTVAMYKGFIVGSTCFLAVLLIGLLFRYIVKYYYSMMIGIGEWAIFYYLNCAAILVTSLGLWIYTTVISYKFLCPSYYDNWVLSIGIAMIEAVVLFILVQLISCVIQALFVRHTEQYLVPDDYANYQQVANANDPQTHSKGRQQHQQQQTNVRPNKSQSAPSTPPLVPTNTSTWPTSPGVSNVPIQYVIPQGGGYVGYGQPLMVNPMIGQPGQAHQVGYKAPTYFDNANMNVAHQPNYLTPQQQQLQTQQQQQTPQHLVTFQQPANQNQNANRGIKRIGSNESTGSNYYQQLMKNKGGITSISQYGELLKQKRAPKDKR